METLNAKTLNVHTGDEVVLCAHANGDGLSVKQWGRR